MSSTAIFHYETVRLSASSVSLQVVRTDADVARVVALGAAAGRTVFDFTVRAARRRLSGISAFL